VQQTGSFAQRQWIAYQDLPLAVYREIAAHLRQVEGIKAGPIPQTVQHFNYNQSQLGGLWIEYGTNLSSDCHQKVEEIIDYYSRTYGVCQRQPLSYELWHDFSGCE
jgi:hypothetical protein